MRSTNSTVQSSVINRTTDKGPKQFHSLIPASPLYLPLMDIIVVWQVLKVPRMQCFVRTSFVSHLNCQSILVLLNLPESNRLSDKLLELLPSDVWSPLPCLQLANYILRCIKYLGIRIWHLPNCINDEEVEWLKSPLHPLAAITSLSYNLREALRFTAN